MKLLPIALVLCLSYPAAAGQTAAGFDFFEKRIRPLLAQKCYACHSASTVASGGLRLDTRDGLQQGGKRGPVLIPGRPDASLVLRAVSHADGALRMPPSGRLTDSQIADLTTWIEQGAPDPRDGTPVNPGPEWTRARRHWAFQPFRVHTLPRVAAPRWTRTWIDYFVLAGLAAHGLRPATAADRQTLIRRVTFDLTGLPPTPSEIDAFLADRSPEAYEKVVERLLVSPHYGERWARHWLDLARYAETDGHEFDREKPNAWRYRDYLIRAFNEDLPFDQFIREHLAGDVVETKRMSSDGSYWDSPVATGFFGLGEERNAADDLAEVRAEKLDNQIDALSKSFLGLTVSCARCHDHKFDPVSTRDYYALGGVLDSKQVIQACLDAPSRTREAERIASELSVLHRRLSAWTAAEKRKFGPQVSAYLSAAVPWLAGEKVPEDSALREAASRSGISPELLKSWVREIRYASREPDHVLWAFAKLAGAQPGDFAEHLAGTLAELEDWTARSQPDHPANREPGDVVIADFSRHGYEGWRVEGPAFGGGPSADLVSAAGYRGGAVAHSLRSGAAEFSGFLYSRTFRADRRYVHVRLAGSSDSSSGRQPGLLRVSLVGDGRDVALTADPSGRFTWKTAGLGKMSGELAFVEIADRSRSGYVGVEKIVLSNSKEPPPGERGPDPRVVAMLRNTGITSLEALASAYQDLFQQRLSEGDTWLTHVLPAPADTAEIKTLRQQAAALARGIPEPAFGMVSVEDEPRNLRLHIGGNPHQLGDEVPRGFLRILAREEAAEAFDRGSGRMQLAAAIASPANPLTARVIVNRVWMHHFGQGLVRTPDNFGRTGEAPTHPELLDTLAARFVEGGWSLKKLHRTLVLSAAYRMSSRPDPKAVAVDGDNRWLHHMPVRRLEGESIRDAVLAVTGSLDRTLYGPSVPPHISAYQDGRGKPRLSGPVDGAGRRSIYIGVRRNFLTPLLVAFDYPMTVTAVGRRGSSTVPSQALILMNNAFVTQQAARWADRVLAIAGNPRTRIEQMYRTAFGRPADSAEIVRAERFVAEQSRRYGSDSNAGFRSWADLAHVLINSKEFIFIR